MVEQNRVGHAQHLKAVNHPIRREMLRFVNESEEMLEKDLLKKLKDNEIVDSQDIFKYHMDFLLQTYCIERIEKSNETYYKILPAGKVIENF
jgi:DNA-binding transcriptional ArsR family regulator